MTPTVLAVDNDADLVDLLKWWLTRAGFEVRTATSLTAARAVLAAERPALMVLDISINEECGLDLLQELRDADDYLPVILLTANVSEEDRVNGLDLGADDYVTKPFSPRELVSRIRAVLRRYGRTIAPTVREPDCLTEGLLTLYPQEHRATLNGERLTLTPKEYRLIHYLMVRAGSVVPTPELLKHVWGWSEAGNNDAVRVTVHRLRGKLGETAEQPALLHTVPGIGVMLKAQNGNTEIGLFRNGIVPVHGH